MRRWLIVAGAASLLPAALPALAQKSDPAPIFISPAPAPEPARQAGLAAVPLGTAGVLTGFTVGVPVKISRTIVSETKRMTVTILDDFGGSRKIVDRVLAASIGVPYGIASGTVLGSIRGVQRAIKYGYAKPFSPESLGMVEPEE